MTYLFQDEENANGKFDDLSKNAPACTTGCVAFPDIPGFEPVSKKPLLPDKIVTYQCAIRSLIPHNGVNITMKCLSNGTFAIQTEVPVCVPKETCRQPVFPNHENYTVANPEKVSYNYDESIEMKCKDPDMVAEDLVRRF